MQVSAKIPRRAWKNLTVGVLLAVSLSGPCLAQANGSGATSTGNPLIPLCAPYALYPDSLLAQVLAASTYPDQVMAATVWCTSNPGVQGSALDSALAGQNWDPSIKALCAFPDVLKKMSGDMNNTQALGQDFLQDKSSVMDCIQALRAQAQTAGALKTTPQQQVVQDGSTIVIQQANPNTVYVPTYDPTALYDSDEAYGAGLVSFGAGVALGACYTNNYGAFNWADHGMYCGAGVYSGAAYRTGVYGSAYAGATAWGHNYGYGAAGGYHTGRTGVYTGPMGNTTAYHTGTTAAGYRGYGGAGGAYSRNTAFATTAGGGYASRFSSRGFASMGAEGCHFGGFRGGGFRGGGFRR